LLSNQLIGSIGEGVPVWFNILKVFLKKLKILIFFCFKLIFFWCFDIKNYFFKKIKIKNKLFKYIFK